MLAQNRLFDTPSTIMPERVIVIREQRQRRKLSGGRPVGVIVAQPHDHQSRHVSAALELLQIVQKHLGALHVRIIQIETAIAHDS